MEMVELDFLLSPGDCPPIWSAICLQRNISATGTAPDLHLQRELQCRIREHLVLHPDRTDEGKGPLQKVHAKIRATEGSRLVETRDETLYDTPRIARIFYWFEWRLPSGSPETLIIDGLPHRAWHVHIFEVPTQ